MCINIRAYPEIHAQTHSHSALLAGNEKLSHAHNVHFRYCAPMKSQIHHITRGVVLFHVERHNSRHVKTQELWSLFTVVSGLAVALSDRAYKRLKLLIFKDMLGEERDGVGRNRMPITDVCIE